MKTKNDVETFFFLGFIVCKIEKKMDKINFNKFIWVIGKIKKCIYIYIYIWGSFSSSWDEKKKM